MVNGFHDVVTMRMKFNWKSNCAVSITETVKIEKAEKQQHAIQPLYTQGAPYMEVSLKTVHAFMNIERGAERGGAEVDPEAQNRL